MATPTTMTDLSVTAASNSPAGSESPTAGDDFLRAIQAILRTTNAKGADIASATTTDIGAATGEFVDVTGTTTITGLGTIAAGIVRTVRFTGALTLTHNATSLILPTSANITTANGDVAQFRSLGSGNWKCVGYIPQAGYARPGTNGDITSLTACINITAAAVTVATDDKVVIQDTSDGDKLKTVTTQAIANLATAPSGSITASGYTQNTSKLLGRTTAAAGAIEEISIGTGLSLSAGSLSVTGAAGALIGYQIFTTTGAYTKATNNPTFVIVEVVGGGGGSGGSAGVANNVAGSGGGGGYSMKKILASALAASETVTVGTGGTAGAAGSNAGGTGNTSSFGVFCSATGGGAGAAGSSAAPKTTAGGAGSSGDINLTGGTGMSHQVQTTACIRQGGNTQYASSAATSGATAGVAGVSYGGGASGSYSTGSTAAGAVGADGIVIVWEYA